MTRPIVLLAILCGIVSFSEDVKSAEEYPSTTILHHTVENSALNIYCRKKTDGALDCSFLQMRVINEAKASELQDKISKKKIDSFLKEVRQTGNKMCSDYSELHTSLKTGIPLKNNNFIKNTEEFKAQMASINPRQKKDLLEQTEALRDAACNPNRKSVENVIRLIHNKNVRTCRVSVHKFDQSFILDPNSGNWVHTSAPEGPCGKVHIGTFKKAKTSTGFTFWNYATTKVITNKEGNDVLLGSCKNWDEGGYTYSWRSKERFLGCDYIKFSAF